MTTTLTSGDAVWTVDYGNKTAGFETRRIMTSRGNAITWIQDRCKTPIKGMDYFRLKPVRLDADPDFTLNDVGGPPAEPGCLWYARNYTEYFDINGNPFTPD